MGVVFFKIPKYNKFNYQPLYYDAKKEEREKRNKQIKAELGLSEESDVYVPHIKGQFKTYFRKQRLSKKSSNVRLVIIMIFLMLVSYYLFFY